MSAEVIPLPTLEAIRAAREVISRPDNYDEDVVMTAIQTLMWRGNWIDYDRARMLLRALQDQKLRRWLAEQDAAKAAADKARRTARLRAFNRQVLVPGLWLACGFAAAALLMWALTP